MKNARLIALWLLMLVLPLQGLAAVAPSARCADDPSGTAVQTMHDGHHGVAQQAHDHPADYPHHDDGQPADQFGGHACSYHLFSGMPSTTVPDVPAPPHTAMPRVSLLTTLHIPELPQRPPRA